MFVKLHRIEQRFDGSYYLAEVRLNVSHISYISENMEMKAKLQEGKLGIGLHESTTFTNVTVSSNRNTERIVVVGDPELIESRINKPYKQLLRG
tara:strand:+ start:256 stop:537 length:282 start_codon:yes stop_codon:yes gene_type:complete